MKLLQAPNLKTIALTKAMYPAIHNYDEQAFDNIHTQSSLSPKSIKIILKPISQPKAHYNPSN